MSKTFLGIDVSTSGVKALLIDAQGKVLGEANTEQPFDSPKPLWIEQDPQVWWQSTLSSLRKLGAQPGIDLSTVGAIGMTGQMHGLTLLDENDAVLRPAILWNDQRTGEQCDTIRERVGAQRLVQICGNDAMTGFTAPKILWVAENEPEIYARIAHILLPKDFVRWKLTGVKAMDCADGSGTILFDLAKRSWSPELLEILNIRAEWLPPVFEGPEITGLVSPEAAAETGIPAGTPVVAGGGDQAAGAVGVGAIEPGIVSLVLGTSGVVFAATGHPFTEKEGKLQAFCHASPGKWHLMGVVNAAGGSLRWFRDTFTPGMGYDELLKPAEQVPPGCEGLFFVPYLTGERTPHSDPYARGAFSGLTIRHGFPHLTRAVVEGISFALRDVFDRMSQAGLPPVRQLRVSGGGARSPLWCRILAGIFDAELVTVNTSEAAAYGAALLAGVGTENWKTVEEACTQTIHITGSTQPVAADVQAYAKAYPLYQAHYPALHDINHAMRDL